MLNFASQKTAFHTTLKQRVTSYFAENKISKFCNIQMISKTIILTLLFFIPYCLILSGQFKPLEMLGLIVIMSIANAGLGMCVYHDAVHQSYSPYHKINTLLGSIYAVLIIGSIPKIWKIQHNVLHHRYTNIYGFDDDLSASRGLLRYSKEDKQKSAYRYQHIYAFFLYTLMTFIWVFLGDFNKLIRYKNKGLITKKSYNQNLVILIINKSIYFGFMCFLPLLMLDITIWQWLTGFLLFHIINGLILSIFFQLAHVVQTNAFPLASKDHTIEDEWAIHQMSTTSNFAISNPVITWYSGCLNFQIEHHLFPNICHVHYPVISKIIQQTAKEFGVPYHTFASFSCALQSHYYLLKNLGKEINKN